VTAPDADGYAQVATALLGASSAVVCAHVDPDGDAIGSVLGLTLALRRIGVDAVPALAEQDGVPPTYAFLPGFEALRPAAELEPPPLVIALDTPSCARLGAAERLVKAADRCVVLDHHPDNARYANVNLVDPTAAATGQIVWRLLPLLGVEPDAELARCLYVALLTDTGRFQYGNTNATVLRDAAAMLDTGVDAHDVYLRVYENQTLGQMEMVGRVKARVHVVNHGRVAYSFVEDSDFAETGASRQATENLVDAIRVLGGVDAVFLAKVTQGECRVSLRAKSDVDVGGVARGLGGGGHRAAAGFTFTGTLEELLGTLLPLLPDGEA
jgi:bifunctional oligoribonuclease and PAP phosphatase NrnA